MNFASQDPIAGWELRIIDHVNAFIGKPKPGEPNVLWPCYMAQVIVDPQSNPKNMRLIRNVIPLHWLGAPGEIDVSAYSARIHIENIGIVVREALIEQLTKMAAFLPDLLNSERGAPQRGEAAGPYRS